MFDSHIEECIKQLSSLPQKQLSKIPEIIQKYCPIITKTPAPLPETDFHREDLIEDKYIPSPDLMNTYNSLMIKTLNVQSKPENSKLKQTYGNKKVSYNTFDFSLLKNECQNPLNKPSILVQQRQQTILKNLQQKKIEATLPQMQNSLRMYELNSLKSKQIKLQNSKDLKKQKQSLQEWKKMRQKLVKNLQK